MPHYEGKILTRRGNYMRYGVFEYRKLWIKLGLEYRQVVKLSFRFPRIFEAMGRIYVLCHNTKWRAKLLREVFRRYPSLCLRE